MVYTVMTDEQLWLRLGCRPPLWLLRCCSCQALPPPLPLQQVLSRPRCNAAAPHAATSLHTAPPPTPRHTQRPTETCRPTHTPLKQGTHTRPVEVSASVAQPRVSSMLEVVAIPLTKAGSST